MSQRPEKEGPRGPMRTSGVPHACPAPALPRPPTVSPPDPPALGGQAGLAAFLRWGTVVWQASWGLVASHRKHLDVKDERLGVLLQGVQIGMAQGAVLLHLGNATAVPLALQGVLAGCNVAQTLGHHRIQDHVLQKGEWAPEALSASWSPG